MSVFALKSRDTFLPVLCLFALCFSGPIAAEELLNSELVFPLREDHNHAPGIVELPNGELLASWYRGEGERKADNVAIYGARLAKGSKEWTPDFLMADYPGFPDCNTALFLDKHQKLWLFWPIILDNNWESALTNYLTSTDYSRPGTPQWSGSGVLYLKPEDFSEEATQRLDKLVAEVKDQLSEKQMKYIDTVKERLKDKLLQRLGWMVRCKPIVLPTGRILLPLYCDTYSFCIMAISDDDGRSWYASKPLIGFGNIQATLLRKKDGTIVAYMRENGMTGKIRVCESKDDGITWGEVTSSELPNPGAGIDGVVLANGHWVLIYNDQTNGRNHLAVSVSDDDGATWKGTRHLEKQESGSYHYPAIIQTSDGVIHAIYSYFIDKPAGTSLREGKSMKHAAFNESWILEGDAKE